MIGLTITLFLSVYLWAKVPSWEKRIFEIISSDQNSFQHFGTYGNDIVLFLLNYWEIISFIILIESLYAMVYNRELVNDVIKEIRKLFKRLGIK